jgi:hypothetical protein
MKTNDCTAAKNHFSAVVHTIIHFHRVQKKYTQNLDFNIEGMTVIN